MRSNSLYLTMTDYSNVESCFLKKSERLPSYPNENLPIIEVQNVYELGQLVAISFLEWVQSNPTGVIALPTGRTPEYFIKTMDRYRSSWSAPETKSELTRLGFDYKSTFPDTSQLKFVMLDEFFPMSTAHRNSFCNYVRNFYLKPLGIKDENVIDFDLVKHGVITEEDMLVFENIDVDLSLLDKKKGGSKEVENQRRILRAVQDYCDSVEEKIRSEYNGIGFFLGGIGPDGHVAFNQQDQPLDSRTRLVNFNYPTAAAAAGDLGGIEKARGKAAVTIGLTTITCNPQVKAIIMAAGEGKAEVVRSAVEDGVDASRPCTALYGLPNARLYLTHGAASKLSARKAEDINDIKIGNCVDWALNHLSGVGVGTGIDTAHMVVPPLEYTRIESLIYNAAKKLGKPVHQLQNPSELKAVHEGNAIPTWLHDTNHFRILVSCAARRLREKIDGGLRSISCVSKSILHTAPHHDDIMLSYHGAMHEMLGRQPAGMVTNSYSASIFQSENSNRMNIDVEVTDSVSTKDTKNNDKGAEKENGGSLPTLKRSRSGSFGNGMKSNTNLVAPLTLGEKYNGNVNHFAYLTSGFHSVEDRVLWKLAESVLEEVNVGDEKSSVLSTLIHNGELTRDYDELMALFRDAFMNDDEAGKDHVEKIIFLRMICYVWSIDTSQIYANLAVQVRARVDWLITEYLPNHSPGDAVPKEMQMLKGTMRESEVDRVWALSRMPMNRIHHMRSKFYTDDFFCPMPSIEDDAMPVANLLRSRQPEIITVAFDPEGTGPDTHYKVLQVIAAGLRLSLNRHDLKNANPIVWGYRNVWFVFSPSEATLMIPCSMEDLDLMHATFMSCFTTQKAAAFPSPSYDGPFSAWAKHLQIVQKEELVALLGEEYFKTHSDERVRECSGFIFLRAMFADTFLKECEGLKSKFELV